jgi:undecaprenyl-diphosphatase
LPERPQVARFDTAVDQLLEKHLRGHALVDRVMYTASTVGEHSAVWLALSALEGLSRGNGRRALSRAGIALGAESLLVNGTMKAMFRRRRPEVDEPRPHYLRQPLTSSFPSGHASSAFFAAALLRDSPLAPAYYALAMVVAASRVHVRVHHASDVVGGAVVGAVMGEMARFIFPLRLRRR